MPFLDEKYLLQSETALALYKSINELQILDMHSHIDVSILAKNKNYENPWQLFAGSDHYIWEMLRRRGVEEKFITGDAAPKEKWLKMASVFPEIAGNPVYEWIHLELRKYLDIETILAPETGEEIWDAASKALKQDNKRPLSLLKEMNIETVCSIDDPLEHLENHEKINRKLKRQVIRPTWRPDKAINIASPSWYSYMNKIEDRYNVRLTSVIDLVYALQLSHNYFEDHGCVASDYNFEFPVSGIASEGEADLVFNKAISGSELTPVECRTFMSYMLGELAEMDAESGWVCQLHLGAHPKDRDEPLTEHSATSAYTDLYYPLKDFLTRFSDRLKVTLYCLDANQQGTLAELARQAGSNVHLGSAWWLNDTPIGLRRQLEFIGSIDLLSNFAGMVSDSHKILSVGSRFDMFRRILADTIATMVELGQIPFSVAVTLAERMAYSGPHKFWNL